MLDSEEKDLCIKVSMEDSKAENDKRNWMTGTMAVSKTKESHSMASSFAKILISEYFQRMFFIKDPQNAEERRNKNRKGICVYSI